MSGFSSELVWRSLGDALAQVYQKNRKISLSDFFRHLLSDYLLASLAGTQTFALKSASNLSQSILLNYILEALKETFEPVWQADAQTSVFQFMKYPIAADWGNGCDARAYQIVNSTPQGIHGFYEHGHLLDASYRAFIHALCPAAAERHPRYQELENLVEAGSAKELAAESAARQAYKDWKTFDTQSLTYTQWLNDEDGLFWRHRIGRIRETIALYEQEQDALRLQLNQSLNEAREKLNPPAMEMMNVSTAGGKAVTVPKVTITGNLTQDKARWLRSPAQYTCDICISPENLIQKLLQNLKNEALKGLLYGYIKEMNTKHCYELHFKAVGIACYNIIRGNWFCGDLVRADAAFIEGGTLTKDAFFGAAGSLRLLPTSLLVLYRPEVEIRSSSIDDLLPFTNVNKFELRNFSFLGFPMNAEEKYPQITNQKDDISSIQFFSPEDFPPQVIGFSSLLVCGGD